MYGLEKTKHLEMEETMNFPLFANLKQMVFISHLNRPYHVGLCIVA